MLNISVTLTNFQHLIANLFKTEFLNAAIPHCGVNFCKISLHFNGHLPDGCGLANIRMFPFWILLQLRMTEVVGTTGAISHEKLQIIITSQQTQEFFYRLDALRVAQPTVSKH